MLYRLSYASKLRDRAFSDANLPTDPFQMTGTILKVTITANYVQPIWYRGFEVLRRDPTTHSRVDSPLSSPLSYGAAGVLARPRPLLETCQRVLFFFLSPAAVGSFASCRGRICLDGRGRPSLHDPALRRVERHQPSGSAMISASCALET